MQQIILEFEKFIGNNTAYYQQFYIGVASNLNDRLANGHNVDKSIPCIWSINTMQTNVVREIEKYFLNKGCKGAPGGGDNNTCYVYAYLITSKTRQ